MANIYLSSNPKLMEEKNLSVTSAKEPTRGVYPMMELNQSLAFITKIYIDLGYSHYHDKEAIAKVHGTGYNSIKQKLSTAQQYGLLELKYGTGYKITPLFLQLYRPETESERFEGVKKALVSPPLYLRLIEEYNGSNVPSLIGLSTTLFRRYGLHESASGKAAQVFLANLGEHGLLSADNILNFEAKSESLVLENSKSNDEFAVSSKLEQPMKALPPAVNVEIIDSNYLEIPIPLKNGKAYLRIPEGATEEDFVKIARVVEAYK